jgi:hypothetical protein
VLPIGAAAGFRWHTATNFYLGFSAMVNWAITVQNGEGIAGAVMPTPSDRQTVFLASITVGVTVDIGDFLYVGGAALVDLRSNTLDALQPLLVFGLAPGLLQVLQALH